METVWLCEQLLKQVLVNTSHHEQHIEKRNAIITGILREWCCFFDIIPESSVCSMCALRAEPWVPSERFAEDDDAVPGGQHQARVALEHLISLPRICCIWLP